MARQRTAGFGLLAHQLTNRQMSRGFMLACRQLIEITACLSAICQVLNV